MTRSGVWAALAVCAGLLTIGTSCGGSGGEDASPRPVETSTTRPEHATDRPVDGSNQRVVNVNAVDYSFQNLPTEIKAGDRLTLKNSAVGELHELVAIRLADNEERPVSELAKLPAAELGQIIGGAPPAAVLLAAPGSPQVNAVGDGTLTQPGRYMVLCSIPTGADPGEYLRAAASSGGKPPQVAGGPPHLVNGMFAELRVR